MPGLQPDAEPLPDSPARPKYNRGLKIPPLPTPLKSHPIPGLAQPPSTLSPHLAHQGLLHLGYWTQPSFNFPFKS